ncbi:MAG: Adenosylcobinamide-phosphate guanylyltransferase [Candidatus Heimdallarchaeota archaeon LC_2]|nr:MAG: Adenosylcobinamide-phosphate guanylyltransferase [Candidatus Heimdallarchaeota archaeon LC_2]
MIDIDVLIMAGGKGTRLNLDQVEKPIIRISGKPMINYICEELQKSKFINNIWIATSKYTKKTMDYLRNYNIIETEGNGYVKDLNYAVQQISSKYLLVSPCDLPLIRYITLDKLIEHYEKATPNSLVVVVPTKYLNSIGFHHDYSFDIQNLEVVPCGVSILDIDEFRTNDFVNEEHYISNDLGFIMNVNTKNSILEVEKLLK